MKTKALLFLSTASLLHAGTSEILKGPDTGIAEIVKKPASTTPWITPLVDIRLRYEYGEQDPLDASHSLTVRERIGFKTKPFHGFGLLAEGEFTQVAVSDYDSSGTSFTYPRTPGNTVIADPRTNELNQALVSYEGFDSVVKVGRQKIVYDNAAFVGDVIWRQNQQTFDAFTLTNKSITRLTVNYAYVDQVNRIFGSEADAPLLQGAGTTSAVQDLGSDSHLLNISYLGDAGFTVAGYAYFMDFERSNWDNNTFGGYVKGDALGLSLYGELAVQEDAGITALEHTAYYNHFNVTKKLVGDQSVTLGFEFLSAGFQTPLATLHAFNGWADAFIGGRAEGNHNGLSDLYLSHTIPIFYGIKWTNKIHMFGDSEFSDSYGWEYDSLLVKKFNNNFTAICKFGLFESNDDRFVSARPLTDLTRLTLEMNYTF